jgi:hypothetical protein
MADRVNISLDAKAYYGTAGSSAATELATVGDVDVSITKAEAKTPRRGCSWTLVRGTLKEMEVTFTIQDNPEDAALATLTAAFIAGTAMAFKFLDTTSGEGPDADFEIMSMKRSEKIEEAVAYDFTIKPTWSGRAPTWAA